MTRFDSEVAPVDRQDWSAVEQALDARGNAVLPRLLSRDESYRLSRGYARETDYRSTVVMARHGFGRGEYKYFSYPLPPLLEQLRHALYTKLAPIAERWNRKLGIDVGYPAALTDFLTRCHAAGQKRPTPLILRYRVGDYNCLHQDLYGEHVFPLQVAVLLSEPGRDFEGGEFVMMETRAAQQRAHVVSLRRGDAVVFPVRHRPVTGNRRKVARAVMRHGVSRLRSGERYTMGLIFHDAT
jgi:uncharacterized protein